MQYMNLGKTGLKVSRICLGMMSYGTSEWRDWVLDEADSRPFVRRALELGINFFDTADMYSRGVSEEVTGRALWDFARRDEVVLATKVFFPFSDQPNMGGLSRKHIMHAVEDSLRRLGTDYIDLYQIHRYDYNTPIEETLEALDDLVRAGKVRYVGLSDTPAWYVARAQTLAEWRGWERLCALQLEYSLVERNIEREHVPVALHLGLGLCAWSPLASGLLTGKYLSRADVEQGKGRLSAMAGSGNPAFDKLYTERNFALARELVEVARQVGRSPAQLAVGWITRRPGVASTLIAATKLEQLEDTLQALEHPLPDELSQRLEERSRPESQFPYFFHGPQMQAMVSGGCRISAEPPWFR